MGCTTAWVIAGKTKTIEGTEIKLRWMQSNCTIATFNAQVPWASNATYALEKGESKTFTNPSNSAETIMITVTDTWCSDQGDSAGFRVCHEKPDTTGKIKCITTPSGATIYFNGKRMSNKTTTTLTNVPPKVWHTIKFKKDGFEDIQDQWYVEAGRTVVAEKILTPIKTEGYIKAISDLDKVTAKVMIDGSPVAHTVPHTFTVKEGKHTVTFTKANHKFVEVVATVVKDRTVIVKGNPTPITADTVLILNNLPDTVVTGDELTLSGTLKDTNGAPVLGQIKFYDKDTMSADDPLMSNGTHLTTMTNGSDGKFSIKWDAKSMDLLIGTDVIAKFNGTNLHNASESNVQTIAFTLPTKKDTVLTLDPFTESVTEGTKVTLSGKLIDSSNNAVTNAKITFNDKDLLFDTKLGIETTTNSSGMYSVVWTAEDTDWITSDLELYAVYKESATHNASESEVQILKIGGIKTHLTLETTTTGIVDGDVITLTGKLTADDGKSMSGETIKFFDYDAINDLIFPDKPLTENGSPLVATTTENGNYSVQWTVQDIDFWNTELGKKSATFRAMFETIPKYESSVSAVIFIDISSVKPQSVITLNEIDTQIEFGSQIELGGTLTTADNISIAGGTIGFLRGSAISSKPMTLTTKTGPDGKFSAMWTVDGDLGRVVLRSKFEETDEYRGNTSGFVESNIVEELPDIENSITVNVKDKIEGKSYLVNVMEPRKRMLSDKYDPITIAQKWCEPHSCDIVFTEINGLTKDEKYFITALKIPPRTIIEDDLVTFDGHITIDRSVKETSGVLIKICEMMGIADCDTFVEMLTMDLMTPLIDGYTITHGVDPYTNEPIENVDWYYLFFILGSIPIASWGTTVLKNGAKLSKDGIKLAELAKKSEPLELLLKEPGTLEKVITATGEQITKIIDFAKALKITELRTYFDDIPDIEVPTGFMDDITANWAKLGIKDNTANVLIATFKGATGVFDFTNEGYKIFDIAKSNTALMNTLENTEFIWKSTVLDQPTAAKLLDAAKAGDVSEFESLIRASPHPEKFETMGHDSQVEIWKKVDQIVFDLAKRIDPTGSRPDLFIKLKNSAHLPSGTPAYWIRHFVDGLTKGGEITQQPRRVAEEVIAYSSDDITKMFDFEYSIGDDFEAVLNALLVSGTETAKLADVVFISRLLREGTKIKIPDTTINMLLNDYTKAIYKSLFTLDDAPAKTKYDDIIETVKNDYELTDEFAKYLDVGIHTPLPEFLSKHSDIIEQVLKGEGTVTTAQIKSIIPDFMDATPEQIFEFFETGKHVVFIAELAKYTDDSIQIFTEYLSVMNSLNIRMANIADKLVIAGDIRVAAQQYIQNGEIVLIKQIAESLFTSNNKIKANMDIVRAKWFASISDIDYVKQLYEVENYRSTLKAITRKEIDKIQDGVITQLLYDIEKNPAVAKGLFNTVFETDLMDGLKVLGATEDKLLAETMEMFRVILNTNLQQTTKHVLIQDIATIARKYASEKSPIEALAAIKLIKAQVLTGTNLNQLEDIAKQPWAIETSKLFDLGTGLLSDLTPILKEFIDGSRTMFPEGAMDDILKAGAADPDEVISLLNSVNADDLILALEKVGGHEEVLIREYFRVVLTSNKVMTSKILMDEILKNVANIALRHSTDTGAAKMMSVFNVLFETGDKMNPIHKIMRTGYFIDLRAMSREWGLLEHPTGILASMRKFKEEIFVRIIAFISKTPGLKVFIGDHSFLAWWFLLDNVPFFAWVLVDKFGSEAMYWKIKPFAINVREAADNLYWDCKDNNGKNQEEFQADLDTAVEKYHAEIERWWVNAPAIGMTETHKTILNDSVERALDSVKSVLGDCGTSDPGEYDPLKIEYNNKRDNLLDRHFSLENACSTRSIEQMNNALGLWDSAREIFDEFAENHVDMINELGESYNNVIATADEDRRIALECLEKLESGEIPEGEYNEYISEAKAKAKILTSTMFDIKNECNNGNKIIVNALLDSFKTGFNEYKEYVTTNQTKLGDHLTTAVTQIALFTSEYSMYNLKDCVNIWEEDPDQKNLGWEVDAYEDRLNTAMWTANNACKDKNMSVLRDVLYWSYKELTSLKQFIASNGSKLRTEGYLASANSIHALYTIEYEKSNACLPVLPDIPENGIFKNVYIKDIIDGDSVTARVDGKEFDVRLVGTNSPEYPTGGISKVKCSGHTGDNSLDKKHYYAATEALTDLAYKEYAEIRVDKNNAISYDRILGVIYIGEKDINKEMVLNGASCHWAVRENSVVNDNEYAIAQAYAKEHKLGMWEEFTLVETGSALFTAKRTLSDGTVSASSTTASIYIDDEYAYPTSSSKQRKFVPGIHSAMFVKTGFGSATKGFTITKDKVTEVTAILTRTDEPIDPTDPTDPTELSAQYYPTPHQTTGGSYQYQPYQPQGTPPVEEPTGEPWEEFLPPTTVLFLNIGEDVKKQNVIVKAAQDFMNKHCDLEFEWESNQHDNVELGEDDNNCATLDDIETLSETLDGDIVEEGTSIVYLLWNADEPECVSYNGFSGSVDDLLFDAILCSSPTSKSNNEFTTGTGKKANIDLKVKYSGTLTIIIQLCDVLHNIFEQTKEEDADELPEFDGDLCGKNIYKDRPNAKCIVEWLQKFNEALPGEVKEQQ